MGVGWMISNLGSFVDASPHIALFVPPFSRAVHVWTQADKGEKTDEAQTGHRGLPADPAAVNTSSQLMHSNASFRFMISSADPLHVAFSTPLRCRDAARGRQGKGKCNTRSLKLDFPPFKTSGMAAGNMHRRTDTCSQES